MEFRNPVYTADGRIDCEIEHPVYGWIPFTASANDPEPLGREIHAAALASGPEPYVAPEAVVIVPDQITKVQFVRAMRSLHVGNDPGQPTLWAAHGPTIEAHPDWPYITVLPRFDQLTLDAAALIPATPAQMDAIWVLGATL